MGGVDISHYVKPPSKAARLLIAKHGVADARKHALQELRNGRRARSRIRFTFWTTVIVEIDAHCSTGPVTRRSEGPHCRGPDSTNRAPC
jgi:hypothetical protein